MQEELNLELRVLPPAVGPGNDKAWDIFLKYLAGLARKYGVRCYSGGHEWDGERRWYDNRIVDLEGKGRDGIPDERQRELAG